MRFSFFVLFLAGTAGAASLPGSPEAVCPLKPGNKAPALTLKTAAGKDLDLKTALPKSNTVLVFYRGGWCPYCSLQLAELGRIQPDLLKLGFQLIAVSPDPPKELSASIKKQSLSYQLASDENLEAAGRFGVAYQIPGEEALPVPAVFLVDKEGNIQFTYSNPDYRVRLNPDVLLAVAQSMSDGKKISKIMVVESIFNADTDAELARLVAKDEVYFIPRDPAGTPSWSGEARRFSDGKCFALTQSPGKPDVASQPTECSPRVVANARFPYARILEFRKYRDRFVACLDSKDDRCVKGLVARNVRLVGSVPNGDTRPLFLARLSEPERKALRQNLAQSAIPEGGFIELPPPGATPPPSSGKVRFEQREGAWLLVAYTAP